MTRTGWPLAAMPVALGGGGGGLPEVECLALVEYLKTL